jgi:hypothetical protein
MRKLARRVLPILVIALLPGAYSRTALAQDNVYALSYYSNAHTSGAPDAVLRLVNDGNISDASPAGDLCASTFVFDSGEQLNECCSCRITPNGILSLSVNNNLTSHPLTGKVPTRGVVKVISSLPVAGVCDPTSQSPNIGIRGWQTHIQKTASGYSITEEELTDSTLGGAEAGDLAEDCKVLIELGSGAGVCSCIDSKQ